MEGLQVRQWPLTPLGQSPLSLSMQSTCNVITRLTILCACLCCCRWGHVEVARALLMTGNADYTLADAQVHTTPHLHPARA